MAIHGSQHELAARDAALAKLTIEGPTPRWHEHPPHAYGRYPSAATLWTLPTMGGKLQSPRLEIMMLNIARAALLSSSFIPILVHAADLPPPSVFGIGTYASGPSWVRASESFPIGPRQSTSQLEYYFRVDGPASVQVPLDIAYFMGSSVRQSWAGSPTIPMLNAVTSTSSILNVYSGANLLSQAKGVYSLRGLSTVSTFGLGFGKLSLVAQSNAVYKIELRAFAGSNGVDLEGYQSFAESYSDPYISIGAAFAASNPAYTLSFSPGIDNVISVPEPTAAAMMLGGLAAFGLACMRRRRVVHSGHDESASGDFGCPIARAFVSRVAQ